MKKTVRVGVVLVFALVGLPLHGQENKSLAPASRAKAYGIDYDSTYRIPVTDFSPSDPTASAIDWGFPDVLSRYSPSCSGFCFEAVPRLPDGAFLTGIQAYFCNTDPDVNHALAVYLYNANYDGTNVTQLPLTTFSNSHNGCGEFVILDLTSLNYHVNYYDNQLIVRPYIPDTDGSQAIAASTSTTACRSARRRRRPTSATCRRRARNSSSSRRCTRPASRRVVGAATSARTSR